MVEVEVDFVKVQFRKSGNVMVTIPAGLVKMLKLKKGEKLKVLADIEKGRIIYQKIEPT